MDLTRSIRYLLLLCGMGFSLVGISQNRHVPQHQKPLLGEIHYGNRVGGLMAQEGETMELICMEGDDVLKEIQVYVKDNSLIAGFELEVIKGKESHRFTFGTTQGTPQEAYGVAPKLQLVGISGACGWFLDSLQFHFDDGSATPRYGGNGGDMDFKLLLNQNPAGEYRGRVMGFWGSYTNQLETLGLVFWPSE